MRQSQLFTKARREAPADEVAKNAQLLVRAGYLHKEMAGVYDYLPLGLRVFKKIEQIIREEMDAIGGQELFMTTLQDPELWKKTNRWDDAVVDNWFKSELAAGGEIGIANTHEEVITRILTNYVSSYKDLPLYAYQFQNKFRNELRAKSGIMRVREFVMKDLYSFSRSEEEFRLFYEKAAEAYTKIFERVGLGAMTYRTIAAGGSFTTGLTDEFQTISSAGEDTIYVDEKKKIAVNKEVLNDEVLQKYNLDRADLVEHKSIEVGNIFPLGTKYSSALGLLYTDAEGKKHPAIMGSYGIGLGRLLGTIVEVFADEKGIVWPEAVAPFSYHLVSLGKPGDELSKIADTLYEQAQKKGASVLYDDRDASAGAKFAESDLLGIPTRIVVGRDAASGVVEVVDRASGKVEKKKYAEIF